MCLVGKRAAQRVRAGQPARQHDGIRLRAYRAVGARQGLDQRKPRRRNQAHGFLQEAAIARGGRSAEGRHRPVLWPGKDLPVGTSLRGGVAPPRPAGEGPRSGKAGTRGADRDRASRGAGRSPAQARSTRTRYGGSDERRPLQHGYPQVPEGRRGYLAA